jgi:hypothetical protein
LEIPATTPVDVVGEDRVIGDVVDGIMAGRSVGRDAVIGTGADEGLALAVVGAGVVGKKPVAAVGVGAAGDLVVGAIRADAVGAVEMLAVRPG